MIKKNGTISSFPIVLLDSPPGVAGPVPQAGAEAELQGLRLAFGGFHSHGGTPIAGCFIMENPVQMDDLGVSQF